MAYYHSFAWRRYASARARLKRIPAADGALAAGAGIVDNPFIWPGIISQPTLASGSDIPTRRVRRLKSQRERDYVMLSTASSRDHGKLDHRTRAKALETALERVMQAIRDKEARS